MYEQAVVLMCISTMGLGMQRTYHIDIHCSLYMHVCVHTFLAHVMWRVESYGSGRIGICV